ncbi:PfWMP3_22 [Phormidium phage Pf-WMP3]|uniref:PfWMP3_22 n=1 Tax=Phormidium phage Pf-WMP3 TaxID=2914005 RepID=A5HL36_9CAUD|nr:PfWMP3_22 [Phormidium phage Pf-WMP3]ABQ12462.1 PfWMP3_22 [Phormidium phage Pf-WMP3]
MPSNNNQATFGYVTMWAKDSGSLIASGQVSFKKENLDALFDYLENQEDKNGYVALDIALFAAKDDEIGDFRGSVKEKYVKEETEAKPAHKAKRSL